MTPQMITILLVVIAAIAGYVFGILDKNISAALRKNNQAENPPATPAQTTQENNRPGERSVLKVLQDAEQKIHLEVDGKRLEKPEEMDAEDRQRAVKVVMQLRPWLDGKAAPRPMPAPAASEPLPAASVPDMPAAPAQPAANHDNPRLNPVLEVSGMTSKDIKAAIEKKPTSIVEMIDEVLQTKLPGTPYREKGIHLEEGPLGTVRVTVGSSTYDGIDAVPDPEVRNLIKLAAAEWDKK